MPLSKARQAEYMRNYRRGVMPKKLCVIPNWQLTPNRHLLAHLAVYPEYLKLYNEGNYNPDIDLSINPLMNTSVIPNCPDGRYREQLDI